MKILFLDVDGVLNSRRSVEVMNGSGNPNDLTKLDPIAVGLIRKLCIDTNTDICLSSDWRHGKEFIPIIFGMKIGLPIISRTPEKLSATRGEEIAIWLRKNKVEKYSIVDDGNNFLPEQLPFFVQVDYYNGLSYENYVKLQELLK